MFLSNKTDQSNNKSYFIFTFVMIAVFFVILGTTGIKDGITIEGDSYYGRAGQSWTFDGSCEINVKSVDFYTDGWDLDAIRERTGKKKQEIAFVAVITYDANNISVADGSWDFLPESAGTRLEDGFVISGDELGIALNEPGEISSGQSMQNVQIAYAFAYSNVNVVQFKFEYIDADNASFIMYITEDVPEL